MAIILKSGVPQKGVATLFTLNKTELSLLPRVSSDPYFSNISNWERVVLYYKSDVGNQREVVVFSATPPSPTSDFHVSLQARDLFQIQKIVIVDFDSGTIEIPRNELVTSEFDIDLRSPAITLVTAPANGQYTENDSLDFTVDFDEDVIVTGSPQIEITLDSGTVYADYLSGSGSSSLIFRYTVSLSDGDADGIALNSPIQLNAGTIKDSSGNNAVLDFTPPNTSGILIENTPPDTQAPSILSVIAPSNGSYVSGNTLDFTVNFDENVVVTNTPRIQITLDSGTVYANYLSGSGSSSLIFRYTVGVSDDDQNGIALVSPIQLNLGTIKDAANNNANLSFTPPSTESILINASPSLPGQTYRYFRFTFQPASTLGVTDSSFNSSSIVGMTEIQVDLGSGFVPLSGVSLTYPGITGSLSDLNDGTLYNTVTTDLVYSGNPADQLTVDFGVPVEVFGFRYYGQTNYGGSLYTTKLYNFPVQITVERSTNGSSFIPLQTFNPVNPSFDGGGDIVSYGAWDTDDGGASKYLDLTFTASTATFSTVNYYNDNNKLYFQLNNTVVGHDANLDFSSGIRSAFVNPIPTSGKIYIEFDVYGANYYTYLGALFSDLTDLTSVTPFTSASNIYPFGVTDNTVFGESHDTNVKGNPVPPFFPTMVPFSIEEFGPPKKVTLAFDFTTATKKFWIGVDGNYGVGNNPATDSGGANITTGVGSKEYCHIGFASQISYLPTYSNAVGIRLVPQHVIPGFTYIGT